MGRKEFVESLKRDTGYQEMYDFIVEDFATGAGEYVIDSKENSGTSQEKVIEEH